MLKSKTTWAGLGSIIAAIGYAIATGDYSSAIANVVGGIGLIAAGDAVKD